MAEIIIKTEENESRREVYEALGTFLLKFILEETWKAHNHGFDAGMKEGYREGHKDGMTEAVTTITE